MRDSAQKLWYQLTFSMGHESACASAAHSMFHITFGKLFSDDAED